MPPLPLSQSTSAAPAPRIACPRYDRSRLGVGIVHLGLGGFHRAHLAKYVHDLLELDEAGGRIWGIAGAGLRATDQSLCARMQAQGGLYTLVERSGDAETATTVGSVLRAIYAGDGTGALLDAIDEDGVRIVSLTVTEHGYGLDPATKSLDPNLPLIAADLAEPQRPRSGVGVIVEGLSRRRAAGRKAFTALSCDNIQHSGDVLRRAVLAYADRVDPALAAWIAEHGAFPNTMVDRITPATTEADIADVQARYGVADDCPVVCEPFRQWVVEDRFADGRPEWDLVGVQFVDDVAPYERMKLRLLNASHLAISAPGRLMGFTYVDETLRDPRIAGYMRALMDRETGPTLDPVPGVDLEAYKAAVIERFANTAIKDTVERVNTDAPLNYLLDPLRDRLAEGGSIDLLTLAIAAWMRRVRGVDEKGHSIAVIHPLAEALRRLAIQGGPDPRPLLSLRPLFGELGDNDRVIAHVGWWLAALYTEGASATLDRAAAELRF